MPKLIEQLPERIAELEAEFGSENRFVQDLKRQLAAMKENVGKTTQDVYRMQAVKFSPSSPEQPLPDLQNLLEDPAAAVVRGINKRFGPPSTPDDPAG